MTADYLPLGCFGKLPCYEDFLRGKVLFPASQALQDWILEGREVLGLGGEESEAVVRPKESLSRRFLYGPPGSAELVAGVIRPSTDRGERRSFPFAVYVHFPRRLYGKSYSLLPLGLAPVWDALDDAWDSLANVATRAAFEEVVGSTLIPAPLPQGEAQASYRGLQTEDAGRMFVGEDARLDTLRQNMPGVFRQIRKGGEGVRLELPVSGGRTGVCSDIGFWMDLLNRQFMFRRFEPSVFLEEQQAEKNSRVLFVFGILKATDYPIILGCEGSAEGVSRPARPSGNDDRARTSDGRRFTYADLLATRFAAGDDDVTGAPESPEGTRDIDRAG